MRFSFDNPTLFIALACSAALFAPACTAPTGDPERLGVAEGKMSESDCQAENGTWYQGQCTLGVVDVTADPDPVEDNCWPGDPCSTDGDPTGDPPVDPPPDPQGDPPADPPQPSPPVTKTYAGSASALRIWADEDELRPQSETNARSYCESHVEWSDNGVSHCEDGTYVWGNRLIHTSHSTQCSIGIVYETCTTTISITTQVITA